LISFAAKLYKEANEIDP